MYFLVKSNRWNIPMSIINTTTDEEEKQIRKEMEVLGLWSLNKVIREGPTEVINIWKELSHKDIRNRYRKSLKRP